MRPVVDSEAFVVSVPGVGRPAGLSLSPGRPNPSRGDVSIAFVLPTPAHAVLKIVDVSGRSVATPHNGFLPAGPHVARWDGRDDDGRRVPAGLYFCDLRVGREHVAWRFVVIR